MEQILCVLHLARLVGGVLLENVASSDHHPSCLNAVERSALLLLHQDLINEISQLKGSMLLTMCPTATVFTQTNPIFATAFTMKVTAAV